MTSNETMTSEDNNFNVFSSPEVVQFYANYSGLQSAEAYAFDKYVLASSSILDLGVGCGRTTPHLAAKAARYVGVDYIQGMVDICAVRFPEHTFYCADGSDLTMFEDDSFNLVVFSFNGIDAIPTKEKRLRCIAEVFRVLAPGGLFIFSSHNARMLLNLPSLNKVTLLRRVRRLARAAAKSLPLALRLVSCGAFHSGEGYYFDPAHGGIKGYCSIPKLIAFDVSAIGFQVLEVIDSLHPRKVPRYCTPWYYYVLRKPSGQSVLSPNLVSSLNDPVGMSV